MLADSLASTQNDESAVAQRPQIHKIRHFGVFCHCILPLLLGTKDVAPLEIRNDWIGPIA
jgi:hypothetical protein